MLVMTAKVDKKKIAIILVAVIAVIAGMFLLFGGSNDTPTATANVSNNDARVAFLKSFGWEVTNSPVESSQVRIPAEAGEVFDRYNTLQKSQGYDLSAYAGKSVMRFVYKINNFPGATEPVYATLLVYKNQIIGGDITDTSAKGKIYTFQMPKSQDTPSQDGSAQDSAVQDPAEAPEPQESQNASPEAEKSDS